MDPYEELRLRRMLDPGGVETDEGQPMSAPTPAPIQLPGMSRPLSEAEVGAYNLKAPQMQQPNRLTRAAAAFSGLGAGIVHPGTGSQVAQQVLMQPYITQRTAFQASLDDAMRRLGVEKQAQTEDVNQRRAGAMERTAQAREDAARATESFRQWQEQREMNKPQAWAPTTKEEYMQAHPHPWAPNSMEEFQQTHPHGWQPNSLEEFQQAHPVRNPALTMDDRIKLQENAARVRAKYRAPKEDKAATPASPAAQDTAEHLAVGQLLQTNKDYQQFVKPGPKKGTFIPKTMDELPKSGILGFGANPNKDALVRDRYRQFISDLDKAKKGVLGKKAPAQGWTIEKQEDD